ncbi:hypothetical protein J6590_020100 [Homalodisca vitripennis]|nr:hypothetical protein J6590_020100 [Homalodisca vitripennis]
MHSSKNKSGHSGMRNLAADRERRLSDLTYVINYKSWQLINSTKTNWHWHLSPRCCNVDYLMASHLRAFSKAGPHQRPPYPTISLFSQERLIQLNFEFSSSSPFIATSGIGRCLRLVSLVSKRYKCFVLSFFVVDFLWISSDEHDQIPGVKSERQRQIPAAVIKLRHVHRSESMCEKVNRYHNMGEGRRSESAVTSDLQLITTLSAYIYIAQQRPGHPPCSTF